MEFFVENICLVVLLPLIMCFIVGFNSLLLNKLDKSTLFVISVVSSFISACFALAILLFSFLGNNSLFYAIPWLVTDDLTYSVGIMIDKVSSSFLFVFSLVNIFLQIWAYSKRNLFKNYLKLLFIQNLFLFGMSGIFVSPNLFQTYLFCEVVGVCGYLFLNFDFSNRDESKNAIKSFIFGRIGDLALLFCLLVVLYFSVIYNELSDVSSMSYANMDNIVASMNSLLALPLFVFFCSILLFVIVMKFMQSFVYLTFGIKIQDIFSKIVFFQTITISLIGIYLIFRLYSFFAYASFSFGWSIAILMILFVLLALGNQIFVPLCKIVGWFEKYIVETILNLTELIIRFVSYLCNRFQAGNFQSYLLYSLIGLVFVFLFVFVFYEFLLKV